MTQKTYDDAGNLLSITESGFAPDGSALTPRVTTFLNDGPLGQVTQIDGPRTDVNDITNFEYYSNDGAGGNNRARLRSVTNALGQITRGNIQYTVKGKVQSETRLNGLLVSYNYYEGNDRLSTMTETNGAESISTRWNYLPSGEVSSVTTGHNSPQASTVRFAYDDARRLIRITDDMFNFRSFILDTEGNVTEETTYDASAILHQRLVKTFDAYSRIDTINQANETLSFSYTSEGNVESLLDGNNALTSYSYDGLNRLISTAENAGISIQSTARSYDRLNNLINVSGDPYNFADLDYDDFGNLRSSDFNLGDDTTYTYDEAGNRLTQEDYTSVPRIIQYQYDAINRLISVDADGTADDIAYSYDSCLKKLGVKS